MEINRNKRSLISHFSRDIRNEQRASLERVASVVRDSVSLTKAALKSRHTNYQAIVRIIRVVRKRTEQFPINSIRTLLLSTLMNIVRIDNP